MAEWEQFVFAGDEFLAAYASTEALPQATPYLIGHAVELYLKAVYVAHFGNGKKLDELKREFQNKFNGGHDIKALWDELKHLRGFMADYLIDSKLYLVDLATASSLPTEDQKHISEHFEWYFTFRHFNDLRYPSEKTGSYFFSSPCDFWIKFFRDLRSFLGYPQKGPADHLAQIIKHVPPSGRAYRSRIIT